MRSYLILFISLVKSYTRAHISNCKWFDLHDYCSHIFSSFHSDVLMFINLFIFLHLNLGKKDYLGKNNDKEKENVRSI